MFTEIFTHLRLFQLQTHILTLHATAFAMTLHAAAGIRKKFCICMLALR